MAKTMPKPQLDLDGPWTEQLDQWIRGLRGSYHYSIDALCRARDFITYDLAGSTSGSGDVSVRQVITKTRDELLDIEQVGPKTMEVVDAFLSAHGITELGPVNAAQTTP